VFINQYYYPFQASTGQLLQEVAEYLVENGKKVVVVTGINGNRALPRREKLNGVTIFRIPNFRDGSSFGTKIFSYFSFLISLKKFLRKGNVEQSIIFAFSTPPLCGIAPLKHREKKKIRLVLDNQDLYPDLLIALQKVRKRSLIYRVLRKIAKNLFDESDRIITVGQKMKEKIREEYGVNPDKITVIENWALKELECQNPSEFREKSTNEKLKILYTGNMGRSHEYQTLLEGLRIYQNHRQIELIVTGGGYNHQKFRVAVEQEGLKNIYFDGFVGKDELCRLIDDADLCVVIGNKELCGHIVPSKFYGYLARGKPILYINSGTDEVSLHIEEGAFGYQIPNRRSDLFSDIINEICDKKEILAEMRKNAILYYRQRLRRTDSLRKYLEVVEEMEEIIEE